MLTRPQRATIPPPCGEGGAPRAIASKRRVGVGLKPYNRVISPPRRSHRALRRESVDPPHASRGRDKYAPLQVDSRSRLQFDGLEIGREAHHEAAELVRTLP